MLHGCKTYSQVVTNLLKRLRPTQALSERSVFAHASTLCDSDTNRTANETGLTFILSKPLTFHSASGYLNWAKAQAQQVNTALWALGGHGCISFRLWRLLEVMGRVALLAFPMCKRMNEAPKWCSYKREFKSDKSLYYIRRLGGGKSNLRLDDKIGTSRLAVKRISLF